MDRRDILKKLFFSSATAKAILTDAQKPNAFENSVNINSPHSFKSQWHLLPDMVWTGENTWAQRLQDWAIKNGELQCVCHGSDRTLFLLTHQIINPSGEFSLNTVFRFLHKPITDADNKSYAGFRVGVTGRYDDYRSAIMTGRGFDIGVSRNGYLFINDIVSDKTVDEALLISEISLALRVIPQSSGKYFAKLKVLDKSGNTVATLSADIDAAKWKGSIALVSHFDTKKYPQDEPSVSFHSLAVEGKKLAFHPEQEFGPIYFAQYTVQSEVLKLTAQLAPMDIDNAEAVLYIQYNNQWKKAASSKIHPNARIARFRIDKWNAKENHPYKVVYLLPLQNGKQREYFYEGSISLEPIQKEKVKALAFSCNWDFGFPDNEVVFNASKHDADIAFFLGDQFYEPNGGFSIQMSPIDKAELDYLRKWYQFGWSYRELFKHIPMIALPDDHDVYHGNVWGNGGRATIASGTASERQDSGGYKMPAEWVNMAQLTQTSHMPEPFDATPVIQNIGVYYTHWEYAGISFAIIEDRKFKSPPKLILPEEANVWNGYAANTAYDRTKENLSTAQLLGNRQLAFLDNWNKTTDRKTIFKVLVSATPFCCLQTLPIGSTNDQKTPDLVIPEKGEYVNGDELTRDMDSNGWPQNRRNEVLKILQKHFALHLAGDQHLPSVIKYGIDSFGDGGYAFAVPALCNIWPRRWWPNLPKDHQPLPGKTVNTGNFTDGFGNKITVHAVINPHKTGRVPATLYDRVSGYGVVEFDKVQNKIHLQCWPRYVNPIETGAQQYEGWPFTIHISENES